MWWQCGGRMTTRLTLRNFHWCTFQNCVVKAVPIWRNTPNTKAVTANHLCISIEAIIVWCCINAEKAQWCVMPYFLRQLTDDRVMIYHFRVEHFPKEAWIWSFSSRCSRLAHFYPFYSNSALNWICQREFGTADGGLSVVTVRAR